MSNKPDWFAQTAENMSNVEVTAWRDQAKADAHDRGCRFFQFSIDDTTSPHSFLFEGWKDRPVPQPEPRWHFAPPFRA